jgi:hypothetical protein
MCVHDLLSWLHRFTFYTFTTPNRTLLIIICWCCGCRWLWRLCFVIAISVDDCVAAVCGCRNLGGGVGTCVSMMLVIAPTLYLLYVQGAGPHFFDQLLVVWLLWVVVLVFLIGVSADGCVCGACGCCNSGVVFETCVSMTCCHGSIALPFIRSRHQTARC